MVTVQLYGKSVSREDWHDFHIDHRYGNTANEKILNVVNENKSIVATFAPGEWVFVVKGDKSTVELEPRRTSGQLEIPVVD